MLIKLMLVGCVVAVGITLYRGPGSVNQRALRRLASVLLAMAGTLSVLFPDSLTWVANRLGVGRGADLLLYALVVVFAFATIASWQRMWHLERRLTQVTRAVALSSAERRDITT